MTAREAIEKLETIHPTDTPCGCNPGLTWKQSYDIVLGAFKDMPGDEVLDDLFTKRFWQVLKNQSRPKY